MMISTGSEIVCYWGSGSAPSWRVIICIYEKHLYDAQLKLLSMSDKEHKTPPILELNPRGQVPTFVDGDIVINESLAICQYLAYTYRDQGTELLPMTGADFATVLQRIHEIDTLYSKVIDLSRYFFKRRSYYTEEVVREKIDAFTNEIYRWESYINDSYFVGSSFTLADACFFPVLAFLVRLGFDVSRLPKLNQFYNTHQTRESIEKSWPPHWSSSANKTVFKHLLS